MQSNLTSDEIKERVGARACDFVEDGMLIGLGTGSTAQAFVKKLAEKIKNDGIKIESVATSKATENLARSLNIPCYSVDQVKKIDRTFDGADEIDAKRRLIKGAGGALLREKIIAYASSELIIMAEEKKLVKLLGKTFLPIEVVIFGHLFTQNHLAHLGYQAKQRMTEDKKPYITDNNNYIFDIYFDKLREHPEEDEKKIRSVPGVVETGFFFHHTGRIIIGKENGETSVLS